MNAPGIGMTSDRTRMRMVELLRREGITDERVLGAMAATPRHVFVEEGIASRAYEDVALPIGHGQTISSPMIVATMTQLLLEKTPMDRVLEVGTGCGYQTAVLARLVKEVYTLERIAPLMDKARRNLRDLRFYNVRFKHADGHAGYAEGGPYHGQTISSPMIVATMTQLLLEKTPMDRVLEVGTGCGYQTAVLARLVKEVYTLERIAPLMDKARRNLRDLRFYNVRFKHADGHAGYAEGGPYHGILMAASATHVPPDLKMQLAVGGRMVLPVGVEDQWLYTVDRTDKGFVEQKRDAVRFVPLLPGLA